MFLFFISSTGCNEGSARLEVDLLEFLDPVSPIVLEKIPGMPSDSAGMPFFTWRENSTTVYLPRESRIALDVESARSPSRRKCAPMISPVRPR